MGFRIPQVESTLKRTISTVLSRQLSDPRVSGMVSVTRVEVTPDMHEAFVYVSVAPDKYGPRTLQGLQHASRHIHAQVCRGVRMRRVPHLQFRLDQSLKRQAAVLEAIQRASGSDAVSPDDS